MRGCQALLDSLQPTLTAEACSFTNGLEAASKSQTRPAPAVVAAQSFELTNREPLFGYDIADLDRADALSGRSLSQGSRLRPLARKTTAAACPKTLPPLQS